MNDTPKIKSEAQVVKGDYNPYLKTDLETVAQYLVKRGHFLYPLLIRRAIRTIESLQNLLDIERLKNGK